MIYKNHLLSIGESDSQQIYHKICPWLLQTGQNGIKNYRRFNFIIRGISFTKKYGETKGNNKQEVFKIKT